MREKKNAINISLVMIILCLIIMMICWPGKEDGICEFAFVLSSGVFGSGFATLWIFIYEYHKQKRELLISIFSDGVALMGKMDMLPSMERCGLYNKGMKKYMQGKYYCSPVNADCVVKMSEEEKCLYQMSRFVDGFLDIGYDNIQRLCDNIEKVDFWTDSFRKKDKLKDSIIAKLSSPIYDVFILALAMDNGYLFRYFSGFKYKLSYSADEIYDFVVMLDRTFHNCSSEVEFSWLKDARNMRCYMHEKLWIFRDALFSPELSRERRNKARKAFVFDEPYDQIR